jgi:UDP-N-acetylglucosamine 2-epimerase
MKESLILTQPQGYIETLALLKNARCLLTDSGGMQKEAFLLHVPCVTLRNTTEWPETLVGNANRLITNPKDIPSLVFRVALNENLRDRIGKLKNPFGDGHASARIAKLIEDTTVMH